MCWTKRFLLPHTQVSFILLTAILCYFPFINKAIHIDSDMLVHTARQIVKNPLNPPLGEYGRHMVLHDHTLMPQSSVYFRCGHPPLLPAILGGAIALFGDKLWIFHTILFFFYLIAIFSVWVFLGLFFSSLYQFSGTLLWAVSPSLLINSHNIMWDVPIAALMLLAFVLFLKGLRENATKLILFSGVITGLAALTKVNALPLYLLFGSYLLIQRKWKFLLLWGIPAVFFPMVWVIHNIIIYQKIHYISIGWYGFKLTDMRYRIERFTSFLGGAVILPFFWYWLIFARRYYRSLIIISIITVIWSILLVVILKKPVLFGATYILFASCGIWLFYRSFMLSGPAGVNYKKHERMLIGLYAILYTLNLCIFPSASIRYMLPIIPVILVVLCEDIHYFDRSKVNLFLVTSLLTTFLLSIGISVGDYLQCEADRKLPSVLIEKKYSPSNTWYYGRLSYDYYLSQKGFKNLRIGPGIPQKDDFLIDILVPVDYRAIDMLPQGLHAVPFDTINFFRWPIRTIGFYGGFYGDDRLPYTFRNSVPQKSCCIYILKDDY